MCLRRNFLKNVLKTNAILCVVSAVFIYSEMSHCIPFSVCKGTAPSTEVPAGPYPYMVKSQDGHQVPVVQAYAFGKYLGYLKVTFDDTGHVQEATGNPILLDSSIEQGK